MVDAGILSGDFIVVQREKTARDGEIVVAGIPGDEATVKRFFRQGSRIILKPENSTMEPMDFDSHEVVNLRTRHLGPAPLLGPVLAQTSQPERPVRTRPVRSRVTNSSLRWASRGSPAPKFVAGIPSSWKVATSVQPTLPRGLARSARPVPRDVHSSATVAH